jgi:hypothetical protein
MRLVSLRVGIDPAEKRKISTLPEIEPWSSNILFAQLLPN